MELVLLGKHNDKDTTFYNSVKVKEKELKTGGEHKNKKFEKIMQVKITTKFFKGEEGGICSFLLMQEVGVF